MKHNQLMHILDSLTLDQKIGQLVQLSGEFFKEGTQTTETGPSTKLGLENYNIYNTGSAINVTNAQDLRAIQNEYLEKTEHKIPLIFMADIIYGFETIFPIPLAQACTFDFELIQQGAKIVAEEAYYAGQHVTFSPMVDLVRDPRWGRVMESPGEDVYVGTNFARAMVNGFQGKDGKLGPKSLAACVKHFAAYGAPVAGREYGAVDMSEQQLREVYLPSYRAAVDANVKLVMTAFNTLNGIPATGNKWLNRTLLRNEFGFDGVFITDYAAIKELVQHGYAEDDCDAARIAMEAGVDIDMKTSVYSNHLKSLVEAGQLDITLIDEAVLRVLELKNDLGLFENPYRGLDDPNSQIDEGKKIEKGVEFGEKSAVLLKNDNQTLPLSAAAKIAVIGPFAENPAIVGMWAFSADYHRIVTLRKGMEDVFNPENLIFAEGSNIMMDYNRVGFSDNIGNLSALFQVKDQEQLLDDAEAKAKEADIIVLALGESMFESGEGGSKTNIHLASCQVELLKRMKSLGKPVIGVIYTGRPLCLDNIIDDFDALLYAWYPGTYGNSGIANMLAGKANPSGHLAMTFPKNEGQIPIYYNTYRSGRPIRSEDVAYRFTSRYIDQTNQPLFPFGFGLSYSEFRYDNIKTDHSEFKESELITVSIDVTNTGLMDGETVVQCYVHDHIAQISRPVIELKQTKRIFIKAGETKTVSCGLSIDDFKYHNDKGTKVYDKGQFTIYMAQHAEDRANHIEVRLV